MLSENDNFGKTPAMNMTVIDATKGLAHLTVDLVLPMATAAQVMGILMETGGVSLADA